MLNWTSIELWQLVRLQQVSGSNILDFLYSAIRWITIHVQPLSVSWPRFPQSATLRVRDLSVGCGLNNVYAYVSALYMCRCIHSYINISDMLWFLMRPWYELFCRFRMMLNNYHWRELPANIFIATITCLLRQNTTFVATNTCLSRQKTCLSRQKWYLWQLPQW